MPVELVGQQLRIRTVGKRGISKYRVHDVGRKGRLQRLAGYKRGEWETVGWRMNLKDYKRKSEVKRQIKRLRIPQKMKAQAIKKLEKVVVI